MEDLKVDASATAEALARLDNREHEVLFLAANASVEGGGQVRGPMLREKCVGWGLAYRSTGRLRPLTLKMLRTAAA